MWTVNEIIDMFIDMQNMQDSYLNGIFLWINIHIHYNMFWLKCTELLFIYSSTIAQIPWHSEFDRKFLWLDSAISSMFSASQQTL